MIGDYRAGRGMSVSAKRAAWSGMAVGVALSVIFAPFWWAKLAAVLLVLVGAWCVWWVVPNRAE